MSSAFGASRVQVRPPEKGVFPLDHFAECKKIADAYLACLDKNDGEAGPCMELSKQYLECRMDRNLMMRQDLADLGLAARAPSPTPSADKTTTQ